MAYTVRRVSGLSGVSIRTLHFYDEVGLLKPAYVSGSGYRYYEEPQLLTLQQIRFYRELGLELREIKSILGPGRFRKGGSARIASVRAGEKARPNTSPDRDHRQDNRTREGVKKDE